MVKRLLYGMITCMLLGLFGCSPSFTAYANSLFQGKRLLDAGQYREARTEFMTAVQAKPDADSYAFAATASFKAGDLREAEQLIREAERRDGRSFSFLRIMAYKSLILLTQGRQKEGLEALQDYLSAYGGSYPLNTIRDVQAMWSSGRINLPVLELTLDEQITTYEHDIDEFYRTATGWHGQRYRRVLSSPW